MIFRAKCPYCGVEDKYDIPDEQYLEITKAPNNVFVKYRCGKCFNEWIDQGYFIHGRGDLSSLSIGQTGN